MSVHYKFKSALEYDTITFDGLNISVKDLKNAIIQQKRIGKSTDFDLQVTNAQTKEIYEDENALIPKNTSLLIARVPQAVQAKPKTWEGYGHETVPTTRQDDGGPVAKVMDLSSLDASENDKILAMMSQSTQDYDPSNYVKIRGANQVGQVPHNYRCYKCHQAGHWIKDCPLSQGSDTMDIKKSTGIPRSFMVEVEGPQVQGAMMTPYGSFAVPALDHLTYTQKNQPAPAPLPVVKTDIPEDLLCSICADLLTDAVMIPCCGNSFCDECIRSSLLESEDHECPDCHDRDISPGTLIPNRFLRNSVMNFKSTTGYVKRQVYRPAVVGQNATTECKSAKEAKNVKLEKQETPETATASEDAAGAAERPIISEADSTETPKTPVPDGTKDTVAKVLPVDDELPPGVSPNPHAAPEVQPAVPNGKSNKEHASPRGQTSRYPTDAEERSGTPTVDEPGAPPPAAAPSGEFKPYPTTGPPPTADPPLPQHPIPAMHSVNLHQPYENPLHAPMLYGPPHAHYPPPNYRMPPPGQHGYNMYNPPPRPGIYDPPLGGGQQGMLPHQNFYQHRPRPRDYPPGPVQARTFPGIIDDPLEAFNRMLREKDERERRAKANRRGRSYSRSSSRSYSRSPPPRRRTSRSPRRRTRSRTTISFSISRSRSRSYSPNHRAPSYREYSPRRRPACRYRTSPQTSPSRYRYKDGPDRDWERDRDRDRERDRERDRDRRCGSRDRGRSEREYGQPPRRKSTIREYPPRAPLLGVAPGAGPGFGSGSGPGPDYHYYDGRFDREEEQRGGRWMSGGSREPGYPPHLPPHHHHQPHPEHSGPPYHPHPPVGGGPNRYGFRDYPPNGPPPLAGVYSAEPPPSLHAQTCFDDVLPPGTDQPLPPGEDMPPRYGGGLLPLPVEPREIVEASALREGRGVDQERTKERERQRQNGHTSIQRDRDRDRRHSRDRERDRDRGREREVKENDRSKERRCSRSSSRRAPSQKRKLRHDSPKNRDEKKQDRDKEKEKDKDREKENDKDKEKEKDKDKEKEKDRDKEKEKDKDKEKEKDKDKEKEKEKVCSHSEEKKYKDKKKKRDKKEFDKKKKKDKKEKKEHKKEGREHRKEEKDRDKPKEGGGNKSEESEKPQVDEQPLSGTVVAAGPAEPEKPAVDTLVEPQTECIEKEQPADTDTDATSVKALEEIPNEIEPELQAVEESPESELFENIPSLSEEVRASVSPEFINPCKANTPEPQPNNPPVKGDDDILELYTGELKSELDKEMLAPVPEPSKWEVDDDQSQSVTAESDAKLDKSKVTQDVLKRAENAIFAKAINAIRPIEIKKISSDRAKLYAGEKEKDELVQAKQEEGKPKEECAKEREAAKAEGAKAPPVRLSIKERLGHKVDDLNRIVRIDHRDAKRSRTRSPGGRRTLENSNRRVVELEPRHRTGGKSDRDKDRRDRSHRDKEKPKDHERDRRDGARRSSRDRSGGERRRDDKPSITQRERFRNRLGEREETRERARSSAGGDKRKRSRSRNKYNPYNHNTDKERKDDRHRKRDRKDKRKEKGKEEPRTDDKSHDTEHDRRKRKNDEPTEHSKSGGQSSRPPVKAPSVPTEAATESSEPPTAGKSNKAEKHKVLVEEEHFVPDYDAESDHDANQPDKKRSSDDAGSSDQKKRRMESTTNTSSDSSSDDERKRKKHKKHGKKKKRRDSTSSSSSDSSSSDDEKEMSNNKRKKHKKKSKKKKRSKHKS